MATISNHRRCGCDCRDSDRYSPDTLVFNPLFDACSDGSKPPCKYLARFECNHMIVNQFGANEYLFETEIPLRQICEFNATVGQYSALMYSGSGGSGVPFQSFQAAELVSFPYSCSWMDRLNPGQLSAVADQIYASERWRLNTVGTVTYTHINGLSYALPSDVAWDCFGPNTLYRSTPIPDGLDFCPDFVCITPEITRYQSQDGCCDNCYQASILAIQAGDSYFMPQRLEFMPVGPNQGDYDPAYACQYKAYVKLYVTSTSGFSGATGTCFYGQTELGSPYGTQFTTSRLLVQSKTESGTPSRAILKLDYMLSCSAISPIEALFECSSFDCTGGTFNRITNDPALPTSITITNRPCYYEEVNDWGMVPQCQGGGLIHDPNRSTYADEYSRYHCCDPWGECAPGSIQILCPSRGTQKLTGCFCTGGHTGLNSPKGPSRELCGTFVATDGSTHEICAVVYCGDGSAWTSDWYCDGTHVGTGTGGSVTCCPHTFKHDMPTMACLPGCTGCLAINTDPDCQPAPTPECCLDADEPATCHATITSACAGLNGAVVTLTRFGSHFWSGSGGGLPAGYSIGLYCGVDGAGVWTCNVGKFLDCTVTMTSTNGTCLPVISASFSGNLEPSGGFCTTCTTGDSISVVITV